MIRFHANRVTIVAGPPNYLEAPLACAVLAGAKRALSCVKSDHRIAIYEMVIGMTYTILKVRYPKAYTPPGDEAASVMVDELGQVWLGTPTKRRLLQADGSVVDLGSTVWSRVGEWL